MNRIDAYEIFGNPTDLHIFIGQERAGGKYGVVISRGPGHDFKPILDCGPIFSKAEDAIKCIKDHLELARKVSIEDVDQTGNKEPVLDEDLIAWIVKELTENHSADTFERSDHVKTNRKSGRAVSKGRHAT